MPPAYYEVPEDIVERALEYLPEDMLNVVTAFCDNIIGEMRR